MQALRAGILLVVLLPLASGCSEDPAAPVDCGCLPGVRSLAQRDDVLFNLQLATNATNVGEYVKLLDENFTFYFSEKDVNEGNTILLQWDRAAEVNAAHNMFGDGPLPPNVDPISDISLTLVFDDGGDNWTAGPPPVPSQFPNEVWYMQTVDYVISIQAGETTFTSGGFLQAEITVRSVDVGGEAQWRIVSWRDIRSTVARGSNFGTAGASQNRSWGAVKALYADDPFRSLEARDDVLANLELAYNNRHLAQFEYLLDNNFVFHFAASDIDQGNVQVAQWARASEVSSARNLFGGSIPFGGDPVSYIAVQLIFNDGGDDWLVVPPPDPQQYPNETWYEQTVDYFLTVQAGPYTYTTGSPLQAQFTIRQTASSKWRIVSWRDIGEAAAMELATASLVEATTWGRVKALTLPTTMVSTPAHE